MKATVKNKKKSNNIIEPMDTTNTSIMDNFNKTNEIISYLNKQAKNDSTN